MDFLSENLLYRLHANPQAIKMQIKMSLEQPGVECWANAGQLKSNQRTEYKTSKSRNNCSAKAKILGREPNEGV